MEEKDFYRDYSPKKTPDTIYDYLREPKTKIFKILSDIGKPSLDKLKYLLNVFKAYVKEAKKKPGGIQKGNIMIGADLDQYYPSEEELLVSELGRMIKKIIESNHKSDIAIIKKKHGIKSQKIKFNEIHFRHVDVMGSGRYFYAEKIEPKISIDI